MRVTVQLKNPPPGANRWGLTLYDWSGEKTLGTTVYSVTGKASFDIPSDWVLPFRFWISIVYYPNGTVTELHQAQSKATYWPNYVEEFIPYYGSYYYNVTTKKFEVIHLAVIISKEIVYYETRVIFPTTLPIDTIGYAAISCKNNEETAFALGLYMQVKDPAGGVRSESNLTSPLIAPGGIHSFEGANVNFDQLGQWTILLQLYKYLPTGWVLSDQYSGVFIDISLAPPPGISDFAVLSFSKV